MTLFRFRFRDGLRRFCDQVSPEVPLGTSGPTQAPSTYVADRGVCILECMCYSFSPNKPLTRFFLLRLLARQARRTSFRLGAILPIFPPCAGLGLSFVFSLGLFDPPNQYGKAQNGLFILVKMVISLIQPRPSMTDALGGQYFSLAATDRSLSSRRGM